MNKHARIETCYELNLDGFCELIREIQGQGVDRDTAGHYAALIGDTPLMDEQGRIVVMENDDTELARLTLRFSGDGSVS
ncbi:MAG: hypothetical protein QM813_27710 [Verrucomicrobiota bacterium]